MFVGFDNREDIHGSNRVFNISSNFIINFESSFLVLSDDVGFAAGQSEFKMIPGLWNDYLMTMASGRHYLSLWGPWAGLVA